MDGKKKKPVIIQNGWLRTTSQRWYLEKKNSDLNDVYLVKLFQLVKRATYKDMFSMHKTVFRVGFLFFIRLMNS